MTQDLSADDRFMNPQFHGLPEKPLVLGCPEFWPKKNGQWSRNSQSDPVIPIPSFWLVSKLKVSEFFLLGGVSSQGLKRSPPRLPWSRGGWFHSASLLSRLELSDRCCAKALNLAFVGEWDYSSYIQIYIWFTYAIHVYNCVYTYIMYSTCNITTWYIIILSTIFIAVLIQDIAILHVILCIAVYRSCLVLKMILHDVRHGEASQRGFLTGYFNDKTWVCGWFDTNINKASSTIPSKLTQTLKMTNS